MVKDGFKHGRNRSVWLPIAVLAAVGTAGLHAGTVGSPEAGLTAQAAGAKASAPTAAGGQAKKAAQPAKAKKQAAPAPTGAEVPKAPPIIGRRDPFKLPGPPLAGAESSEAPIGPLPPGTRGLVLGQLIVEGIVRLDTTNTMIAVVDNNANRAYFLRENDAIFNGVVAKITPDSVIFRENVLDASGKVYTREVVKRLGQGPGA